MSMRITSAGFKPPLGAVLAALLISVSAAPAAEPWSAVIDPDNSLSFSFLRADRPVF